MKTIINTLLAIIAMSLTASASPTLLVETTISEGNANGSNDVLASPRFTVESGHQASIRVGKLEYAVTPTLLDDGTVDLRAIVTQRDGQKADQLAAPRVTAKLGEVAKVQTGQLALTTKASLVK